MLRLYNTLSRSVEDFKSIKPLSVGLYSCGPTVYDNQHIGHIKRYIGDDVLVKVLKANGYNVKHVMNITDVGHLVSDEDTGEDKMEKGAKKYGMSVWDIAKKFEKQFWDSIDAVGITRPTEIMHATDYIPDQIALVKILEEKGYTYEIPGDGIYFDTSKFPTYFALSRQNPEELKKGARVDFIEGKRNVADFALWKFSFTSKGEPRRQMEWWFGGPLEGKLSTSENWNQVPTEFREKVGFPGWHIECSAMSLRALTDFFSANLPYVQSYLTPQVKNLQTIDIHTGGIDHIAIHHTNEIAQSEAATGEKFVNYWVHHNFLIVDGEKMSKSLGNFYTVQDVVAKGYDPLALRYLILQTHYRQEMNFTWESLDAAQTALERLRSVILNESEGSLVHDHTWMKKFMEALNDDLNTAKALSVMWEMVKDQDLLPGEIQGTLLEMDKILGLNLKLNPKSQIPNLKIPEEVQSLISEREAFRKAGDFGAADEIRNKIADLGFTVEDKLEGPVITKK